MWLWRAVYCALLCVWLANRVRLDYELEHRWEVTRASWWFKHDSFEPVLATVSFGSWILAWRIADFLCPCLHRWRIDPKPVKPPGQGPVEFILRPGIGYWAAAAYLLPLMIFDRLYPRRFLPESCPRYAYASTLLLLPVTVFLRPCTASATCSKNARSD